MRICVSNFIFPAFPIILPGFYRLSHSWFLQGPVLFLPKVKIPFSLCLPHSLPSWPCSLSLSVSLPCSLVFLFYSPPAPLYAFSLSPRFPPAERLSSEGNDRGTLECFARGRMKNKTLCSVFLIGGILRRHVCREKQMEDLSRQISCFALVEHLLC